MKLKTMIECKANTFFAYKIMDAHTGDAYVDRVYDKADCRNEREEWTRYLQYEPYKDWRVYKWRVESSKMIFYILPPRKKQKPKRISEASKQ